jgi:cysteine desulfurase
MFLERNGYEITYLPVSREGFVLTKDLESAMREDTVLVSLIHANNEIGTIQNTKELVEVAHRGGAYFHTDAVQAIGHIPVDVVDLGVDLLSASAHKFNGPKGIGFLYIKNGTLIEPLSHGGAQEAKMRAGTENVAGIVGMATSLHFGVLNMSGITQHLDKISNTFLNELQANHVDFVLNGSATARLPGHISVSIKGASGEMLLHRLDLKGISISTGAACNFKDTEISHVIKAIGVPANFAEGTIRVSFGKYNIVQDAVDIADQIVDILML